MFVNFSESAVSFSADVFVIVSHVAGIDFIEKKIKSYTNGFLPDGVIEKCRDLKFKEIRTFDLPIDGQMKKFVIVCAGKKEHITKNGTEKLGGYIYDAINSLKNISDISVILCNNIELVLEKSPSYLASGIYLKSWTFDKYKTNKKPKKVKSLTCETSYKELNEELFKNIRKINDGVLLTRNLVSEPSNVMTTDQMLSEAQEIKKLGVKVSFLDEKDMEKLNMNAILGVGKGSDMQSYLISMEYRANKNKDTIVLAGKGVTFDSGGLCLKPSTNMWEMKCDMTGAAVVIGTMKSLAERNADVNVVGVIGVVENMISGSAQRPGEVVVSISGKTI